MSETEPIVEPAPAAQVVVDLETPSEADAVPVVDSLAATADTPEVTVEKQDEVSSTIEPIERVSFSERLSQAKLGARLAFEAAMHTAYLRNAAQGWDMRTHLFVSAIRHFMTSSGKTVEQIQSLSKKGLPLKNDDIETIDFCIPAPTGADAEFLLSTISKACTKLTTDAGIKEPTIDAPTLADVPGEWVIYGREQKSDTITCSPDDIVVIYAHGGAHYMGSASGHRFLTAMYAEFANVKVLSIDYRLAPQNPMPAAITDFLVTYMYVLESLKLPCSQVFFAGDSSGGSLCLASLATILNGQGSEKRLPVPAGIITVSPFVDMTRCLPSESSKTVEKFDYLPGSNYYPNIKKSDAWPASNGRYWVCINHRDVFKIS